MAESERLQLVAIKCEMLGRSLPYGSHKHKPEPNCVVVPYSVFRHSTNQAVGREVWTLDLSRKQGGHLYFHLSCKTKHGGHIY